MDGAATLGRGHVFPLDNYKKGARVWHRDPELVWIGGELDHDITFSANTAKVTLENGVSVVLQIKREEDLPFLRNPAILIGKDDLTSLSYLHEPAVLHNLNFRFVEREAIYTYCGIVLVAINPYANCAHLYGEDVIQVYRGVGKSVRDLDPHIYAVAEEAFFDLNEFGKCQSIIVSGESGAGKTVSAKFVMRYLASIASSKQGAIEDAILASNPIMEAIGNAKTIRNDNSSRFGKFIQINFGDSYAITGAEMKTYLLEKSRLVFQANNERNYHIFYQMCKSREHKLLKDFHLGPSESFWYTCQGGDSRIPGVDDKSDFEETIKALEVLKFSETDQLNIMRVLAGILQLGNVQFADGDDSTAVLPHCSTELRRLCQDMYSIPERELEMWLTVREIRAAGEVVRKGLSGSEATRSRDALAKMIYAQLFNWIVHQINVELKNKDAVNNRRKQEKFIGVLDIYGFETFDVNSFEQFCINYANEKLQQQFNQHVFKLEQEEYVREEISWVRIDFHDNQPAIDLIEGRPGLIDYLDEQCKVVKGSDAGWLNQMTACATLKKNTQLEIPRIRSQKFIVKHFAADVPYTIDGFMEKNKDSVSEQLLEVIGKSKFSFLLSILGPNMIPDNNVGGKRPVKKTVASQFRDSLRDLMGVLGTTRPHYVRCIKPNDSKERFYFEPKRAIQQLRACGVLETVRLSAAGFPSRWTYDEFGRRYRVLYPEGKAMWRDRPRQFAEKACTKTLQAEKFALGKTKIFFRTGQVAVLERVRLETLSISATLIQSIWRGFVARRRYLQMQQSIRTIQAATRAYLVYRRIKFLQMHRAAILIQSCIKGYFERQRYQSLRSAVVAIQCHFRGAIVRRMVEKLRYEQSAIVIQKYFRGYLVRRDEIKRRQKIVFVQSCVRRWLAKRRLRELKIEARSVGHLQKLNTGLENKIIELQMKLDVVTSDRNSLTARCTEIDKLRIHVHDLETERSALLQSRKRMEDLKLEVERLQTECDIKDAQKVGIENLNKGLKSQFETLKTESTRKNDLLTEELTAMAARVKELERDNKKLNSSITAETDGRHKAENEVSLMREQLLQNANLLASQAFSSSGSSRQNDSLGQDGTEGRSLSSYSGDVDEIALILQQQRSINEMRSRTEHYQRENDRLRGLMEANQLVDSMDKRTSLRTFESHRLQEVETAYGRLKLEVERLIAEKADSGLENMNVKLVLDRLLEDNDRCREESAELRAMLSNRFERQSGHTASPQPADSGTWSENHSDDGSGPSDLEEELCLERQCRQLKGLAENLSRSLTDRNREIEKLEKRLTETLQPFRPSDCSVDESLRVVHGHLNHLASENISLNDKLSKQNEDLADARAQLRGYTGGLGFALDSTSDSEIVRLETLSKEGVEHSALLEVFNVPEFTRILICDLKPRLARLLTKCFPAYLLLTAFRYHDKEKDETKLTGLFNTLHVLLKDTISRSVDMDVLSVWLVNSWRLLNLLRQYSGDSNDNSSDNTKEWHAANTPKQNLHRLQNYGMESIREQLRSRVEECYQYLMKKAIEPVLSPKIVPGILQHDSTTQLSNGKQQLSRQSSKEAPRKGLDDLLDFLNFIHAKLSVYGADQNLLAQVFGQMTHWICALALNHLMFRRDLCTFEKAIQINYNVMQLENWLNNKGFGSFKDALQPLRQACHLLQCPKDESNIDTLLEVTDRLKPKQVIEILRHYTPGQDFSESAIEPEFLDLVLRSMHERETAKGSSEDDQNALIMRGTYLIPFNSKQFVYSDFPLESLSLPSCLHLQQVCRLR